MDPATQAILAQVIVMAAGIGLAWRLYSIASSSSARARCSRCPEPGPTSSTPELPPGARRPDALRVLSATNSSGGARGGG